MESGPSVPVAFVAHGAPTLAIDAGKGADLARWARAMPRPAAVLAVSAHWERTPPAIGAVAPVDLIYDFHGFPDALYRIRYPAPGAPALAERVSALLASAGVGAARDPQRGLDHGVWVPLVHMYPDADVPVLQISLPSAGEPRTLFELGRALAPLRDEGVLVLASGVLVHNLRALDRAGGPPPPWARAFDEWCREQLGSSRHEALLEFASAPGFAASHPTPEHFLPLLVAAGAASACGLRASFPVEGFEYGSLSRRCVRFD